MTKQCQRLRRPPEPVLAQSGPCPPCFRFRFRFSPAAGRSQGSSPPPPPRVSGKGPEGGFPPSSVAPGEPFPGLSSEAGLSGMTGGSWDGNSNRHRGSSVTVPGTYSCHVCSSRPDRPAAPAVRRREPASGWRHGRRLGDPDPGSAGCRAAGCSIRSETT